MTVHALVSMFSFCFDLFRMQNSQNLMELYWWTSLWWAYSAPPPPDSLAAQKFFSLLHSPENQHPSKIAGYDTHCTEAYTLTIVFSCRWWMNVTFSKIFLKNIQSALQMCDLGYVGPLLSLWKRNKQLLSIFGAEIVRD